ncbi:MAG: hypothetical protein IPK60_20095 [Sandaracinaceae bacterium]|nr:hypothetical protein [Sandaracinaceae bacterium]
MDSGTDELSYFVKHLPRPYVGIALAVLCLGLGSAGFLDPTAQLGVKLGLMIPFGLLSVVFVVVAARPASKHPGIIAFAQRRADIVWIYVFRQKVNGRHASSALVIGLADGKTTQLPIRKGSEDAFLEYAYSLAPRATKGYTRELQLQFRNDPRSLQAI